MILRRISADEWKKYSVGHLIINNRFRLLSDNYFHEVVLSSGGRGLKLMPHCAFPRRGRFGAQSHTEDVQGHRPLGDPAAGTQHLDA